MNLEEGQEYMSTETKRIALQEYDKVVDVLFNNARRQIGLCTNNLNGKSTIKYSNRIIEKH